MAVGTSTVTTIKSGRVPDALDVTKRFSALLSRHGAKNPRTMLLLSSTPIRMVSSYEAEDQTELG